MPELEQNVLVVIVDACFTNDVFGRNIQISEYLDAVIAFVNFYLALKSTNAIAVIITDSFGCQFVYPDKLNNSLPIGELNGQVEMYALAEHILCRNISQFILENANKETENTTPKIAAASAHALCYIARLEQENSSSCSMNSRILLITGCDKQCGKYVNLMNIVFAAQKCNVTIDVCSLMYDIDILQKACDITDGIFFKIPALNGLFQYLLSIFLPDPSTRKKMLALTQPKVDYRPFCYCHNEVIDTGFVCSVCLSAFCKFTPICPICEVVFKNTPPFAIRPKKKKVKLTVGSN